MTDGAWVKVAMTQEGKLQVTDAVKTVRDPLRLSLGTCQQLYLSLRIALLLAADKLAASVKYAHFFRRIFVCLQD